MEELTKVQVEETRIIEEPKIVDQPIEKKEQGIEERILELKALGLKGAANKAEQAHHMTIAYGEFMFISQEVVNKFNEKLRKETLEEDKRAYRYKNLIFIPLENYTEIPPPNVLDKLSKAKAKKIFNRFEIGKIDWVEEMKDPILFGRIDGCDDRFYIAQWDDDVKIEDLLSL